MATYSVNKVILIGNLTRDPELRYTSQGTAVCNFGLATNYAWTTPDGESKESVEFHNIVAWRKLAEICDQLLSKGRKVYVSGRIQTRDWTGDDGVKRYRTEIVIDEMIALDAPPADTKASPTEGSTAAKSPSQAQAKADKTDESEEAEQDGKRKSDKGEAETPGDKKVNDEEVNPDDIPF